MKTYLIPAEMLAEAEIESLRQRVAELEENCDELKELHASNAFNCNYLKKQLAACENERDATAKQFDAAWQEATASQQRINELEPFKAAYLEQVELHNKTLDDLKAVEQQRNELIAQKFAEEPLRRQIAELRELGRFREKHSLTGSPEIYDDPSAEFHKWACEIHDGAILKELTNG